jgi:hypothetical protein
MDEPAVRAGKGHNLKYSQGFDLEAKAFNKFRATYCKALGADKITAVTRGPLDTAAGIDALATIQGNLYPVSLRHRRTDYRSFTLSRHISDKASEAHKWLNTPRGGLKPYYHLQTSEIKEGRYRLILVNIEALAEWLRSIDMERLYKSRLKAYEVKLIDVPEGIGLKEWEIF